jgi:hypothetical protein
VDYRQTDVLQRLTAGVAFIRACPGMPAAVIDSPLMAKADKLIEEMNAVAATQQQLAVDVRADARKAAQKEVVRQMSLIAAIVAASGNDTFADALSEPPKFGKNHAHFANAVGGYVHSVANRKDALLALGLRPSFLEELQAAHKAYAIAGATMRNRRDSRSSVTDQAEERARQARKSIKGLHSLIEQHNVPLPPALKMQWDEMRRLPRHTSASTTHMVGAPPELKALPAGEQAQNAAP